MSAPEIKLSEAVYARVTGQLGIGLAHTIFRNYFMMVI